MAILALRDIDKYASILFKRYEKGAPYLIENSLEAEVINSIDVATHTLFIGKVINSEVFHEEDPMTYSYYQQLKRGTAPSKPSSRILKKSVNRE